MKIQREDYKFVPANAEIGFSPQRNQSIVEDCIRQTDIMRRKKVKAFQEGLAERSDAIATYMVSPKVGKPADKYFGRKAMAYLRGDTIRQRIMGELIQRNTNELYRNLNAKAQKKG